MALKYGYTGSGRCRSGSKGATDSGTHQIPSWTLEIDSQSFGDFFQRHALGLDHLSFHPDEL
jgi:hypothetical protein